MQREKDMAETLKFVYTMILFLFLFFVATESGTELIECEKDSDCPISWHEFFWFRCYRNKCKWVHRFP
ncbi:unnamed protein product [Trifolium pratense]|uniref:Uncharacterized protein n=1 Tax=Trifolium pratense TaxID=57577 RepID=A0ACB0K7B9_TRIPR|nr:unnamed protein product [Trifolium pratense]